MQHEAKDLLSEVFLGDEMRPLLTASVAAEPQPGD